MLGSDKRLQKVTLQEQYLIHWYENVKINHIK